MASHQCQHRGCKNPVRATQTFCYRHGGLTAAELDSSATRSGTITLGELDELRARRRAVRESPYWPVVSRPPASSRPTNALEGAVEAYTRHLPISADAARAVLTVSKDVFGKESLDVPSEAARLRVNGAREFATRLGEAIGPERVTTVEFGGLVRKTATRTRHVRGGLSHQVVVIDKGTDSEVLIDPFIAAFAPVRKEVSDQPVTSSGMRGVMTSPYADTPWIGRPEDYRVNGHIQWQRARLRQG
jgi:hypothetical protein